MPFTTLAEYTHLSLGSLRLAGATWRRPGRGDGIADLRRRLHGWEALGKGAAAIGIATPSSR